MNDLNTYIPEVRHPLIGGKNVTVAPLKVRQIPAFTRAIGPAAGALFTGNLMGAVGAHGEELITAMAVATGEPESWVGELDLDDFMALMGEVVEVNAGFFAHRVGPMLEETMAKLTKATTLGAMPSPSSPPTDTGTPTASITP